MQLETERLIISPLTPEELSLMINNIAEFEKLLGVTYRAEPIEGFFEEILRGQLEITVQDKENYLWHTFWTVTRRSDRIVVGLIDFKDVPDENGCVEIGYGTGKDFENNGYMTETVSALCKWALENENVKHITAETDTDGYASQQILKTCGFSEYSRSETIWWKL